MVKNLNPSTSPILIIGGGTWGSSTALYLARRGYKQVTVLDAYDSPSEISAGNDINKIVEEGKSAFVKSLQANFLVVCTD